jgi:predicted aconitase
MPSGRHDGSLAASPDERSSLAYPDSALPAGHNRLGDHCDILCAVTGTVRVEKSDDPALADDL